MMACGAIGWEAVQRLRARRRWRAWTVSIVALIGVAVNGISAWLFMAGSKDDMNVRAAYQHMAADAAISLGVVCPAWRSCTPGWAWLDPVASL
jgi:cobalt-zinc-cadmium efflux system protein